MNHPWTNKTTTYVEYELSKEDFPVPDWVTVEPDTMEDQTTLLAWIERMGAGKNHMGECTVLNLAKERSFTAVIDDGDARRVAAKNGVDVHGVLWVIAADVERGTCAGTTASSMVDQLIDTGARFPFARGGFIVWARQVDLIS